MKVLESKLKTSYVGKTGHVSEEPTEQNLKSLITKVFGYDSFLQGQLQAFQNVVAGESTVLVLPTGADKLLCYQVCCQI